jgi:hypothetical protein
MKELILPVYFEFPVCGEEVCTRSATGDRVGCKCLEVSYDERRLGGCDGIIPAPGEIIPQLQAGKIVDYADISEETAFRWGRLMPGSSPKSRTTSNRPERSSRRP